MALYRLAVPALALALVTAACAGSGKREAASLVRAVDDYRHADGPAKSDRGRAVASLACSADQVCRAKAACVAAIGPTTRALELKDEVAARVGDIERGALAPTSPEASALPRKLDEAERLLRDGQEKMQACDAALAGLVATFGG